MSFIREFDMDLFAFFTKYKIVVINSCFLSMDLCSCCFGFLIENVNYLDLILASSSELIIKIKVKIYT
jgi:hypothetical protein